MKSIGPLLAVLYLAMATAHSNGDSRSIGPGGVNASGLQLPNGMPLNGTGMGIGQVEGTRPGKPGFDDAAHSAVETKTDGVYRRSSSATANEIWIENHAQEVAGVMISGDNRAPGVAPGALLHASASAGTGQRDYAAAAYHVARRTTTSGEGINAINMSFGLPLDGFETTDGGSHLSSFIDWSADVHDVLYIVAGREDIGGAGPVPSDNYNGITVAGSQLSGGNVYMTAWAGNEYDEDAEGDRVSVDIIAPAQFVDVIQIGNTFVDDGGAGTSIAAPHVTGAVALLQQHAKFQIDASAARWVDPNARRHEVMKAILLNSADKISGVHGSTRNILNDNGQFWEQTTAHGDPSTPLDLTIGAGHLNVGNALTNFEPGEYDPGIVPTIGWDFSPIGSGAVDYILDESVSGWVAVTLAWDRIVTSSEVGDTYNTGTEFFNNPIENELVNLDLYLLDGNDNIISSSIATDDSVEHIFFNVESGDDLKIRVVNAGGGNDEAEGYGLAWWAGEAGAPIPGDFDDDGDVDDDDLSDWKSNFGTGSGADADGDGDSDGADFLTWQRNLGTGVPVVPSAAPVPEPSTWMLSAFALMLLRRRAA